jgi:O-antigen ligase
MTTPQSEGAFQTKWAKYSLFSLCALAFCVNLGTAMVSLSKLLVLIALLGQMFLDGRKIFNWQALVSSKVKVAIVLAVGWMLFSMTWSEAPSVDQWKYFYGHSRLLWFFAFAYLLRNQERAMTALTWLVLGQLLVVVLSWLMWLGLPIPGTKAPLEKGIPFTSTLEQPVMSTVALVLLWGFRDHWQALWGKRVVFGLMAMVVINIGFVMTGRTGYLVLLTFLGIELLRRLPLKYAWLAFVLPVLFAATLYEVSPRFADRVTQIKTNSLAYQGRDVSTSEGQRIDMWYRAALGIEKKPLLGYGVGSYPQVYRAEGGLIQDVVSAPEQQYLLWWVDAGLVGVVFLLSFFAALLYEARGLATQASETLVTTTAIAFVMGLMNCPMFGVGTGEFFLLIMAALLLFKKTQA